MTTPPAPDGILLVDKPAGVTSHDVVLAARRATGEKRIGHTGTLDPFATGLLVLLVGRATRLLPYLDAGHKVYETRIVFGAETDTEDLGGTVTREAPLPSRHAVLEAAAVLTGEILQMPSAYSAKRVGGRRAYAVARKGGAPQLQPVPVAVGAWESIGWHGPADAVAAWDVRVTCGGGTYVRALARDLGRHAASAAHVNSLRRVRSGHFDIAGAVPLRDVLERGATLRPPLDALPHLPHVPITADDVSAVARGIDVAAVIPGERAALVDAETGALVAVAERRAGRWQPRVVMRRAETVGAAARESNP